MTDLRALKIEAARAALQSIHDGMVLGLGTGSTAEELVKLLAGSVAAGKLRGLSAICTSLRTEELCRNAGIPIIPFDKLQFVDLAIDGADEVDPKLRLIKGRGGALLREKIVEQAAKKFIVIADHTKEVQRLGVGPLPVDVVPFARGLLQRRFGGMGLDPTLRMRDGKPFQTDDGNQILDLTIPPDLDVEQVVQAISIFAGVVETGFFPDEASEVIIASPGGVRRQTR